MIVFRIIRKFNQLLSNYQKVKIAELFVLMVMAGFFEMLSVSMMLPFITAVMKPDDVMQNKYMKIICDCLNIHNTRTFLMYMALVMAGCYIVKNLFLLFQMTIQNKFVFNNMLNTQQELLRVFMSRPYEYFLSAKSGEILRIISTDTTNAFSALTNLLSLFSESVVAFAVLLTVFIMAPGMTLFIGIVLLVLTLLIMKFLKPLLKQSGELYQTSYAGMNQWLLQSIHGIKETKLMRKEQFFLDKYSKDGSGYVKASYHNVALSVVPRLMIEAIAMGLFFVAIAMMIYAGISLESIIPVLSVVAMAAIRLLPAMNRISVSVSALIFREPAIDQMILNLNEAKESIAHDSVYMDDEKHKINVLNDKIEFVDVNYKYPTSSDYILEDANITVMKGTSIGIIGASGAGKTTAIDVLLGLLKPKSGKVLVDGTDIEMDIDGWLSNIGYIPQSIFLLDGSIRDNVAFGIDVDKVDDKAVWNALREAALEDFVKSLPDGLNTQIGERGLRVSGGQRQRIGIARALYNDPAVLVFDEATSALDNDTEKAIMESINRFHGLKTLIIIAHRLTTIKNCDSIYRVKNGKIIKER